MTIIDGIVRTQRSRNTPPAGKCRRSSAGIDAADPAQSRQTHPKKLR
jgi:hypothetical protein